MKEKAQIGFVLNGIKTEQFAVFEEYYSSKKETELATQLEFKVSGQDRRIGVFLGFDFKQGKNIFLKIIVSCHFETEQNSWESFVNSKDNKLIIPKDFLAHLIMITTGTVRGVLFAKTEGTVFSKFIIPTLNVTEMISEDVSFEIPKS